MSVGIIAILLAVVALAATAIGLAISRGSALRRADKYEDAANDLATEIVKLRAAINAAEGVIIDLEGACVGDGESDSRDRWALYLRARSGMLSGDTTGDTSIDPADLPTDEAGTGATEGDYDARMRAREGLLERLIGDAGRRLGVTGYRVDGPGPALRIVPESDGETE